MVASSATKMSSHDVGKIQRSTVSEAFGDQETSPGEAGTVTEKSFPEVPLDDQNPINEDTEPCDQENEETLPDENSLDSAMSHDNDSLNCQTDLNVGECSFDVPLNFKQPKSYKQPRNKNHLSESRYPVLEAERDIEDDTDLRMVDSKETDSCCGDQMIVGEGRTSSNVRRPSNPGSCTIEAESHVTKLQSFVDSLAKLTEPSYVARPQPSFLPLYPKITPTKASACIGSYSGTNVRSGFSYFGYHQSPADERGLTTTPVAFLSPLEQPLDLSTKKQHTDFTNEENSGIASPGVRKRCLERGSERLQTEHLRQRPTYDAGNPGSRPLKGEINDATSARSGSFTAGQLNRVLSPQGRHRNSDAGKYKRGQTVGSFGEITASKTAAQTYKISEIAYRKETKQHRPTDVSQRSSVAGKGKYSTFDEGSAHEGREQSPGSETFQKCQRQSVRSTGENSQERGEASMPRKEERGYMNMKCSCGIRFESLYQLAIHIERSGHMPGSLRPESLADLPKLVRGQDVWMSQGPEQAELILRCVQCGTSFRSLPELTFHMIRTKHYVNIVGSDGSAGHMDYGDPPREKESPQRGSLKDSRRKNDMPTVSERSMEMTEQRLQKNNKSPRHNDEASDAMSQIQSAYSGRHHQFNLQTLFSGRGSTTEGVSEVEHVSGHCQENDENNKQFPVVPEEISKKEPVDTAVAALGETKEGSRNEARGDQSLRRHSLASKLHSKISSVTSNIQERISSNQSSNNSISKTASQSNDKNKSRACGVAEKVSDPGVLKSSMEKHSGTSVLRIQSSDCQDAVKSLDPTCGLSGPNDRNRRHKRLRDNDYETENDGTEKKSRSSWRPGHQPSKDPSSTKCQVRGRQLETATSAQDIRKERLLQNVSRWIASTELETKRECDRTQIEDLDPIDNRLELVTPPPQPVETSSILVAIKNFVDSSFCGPTFASGSHSSNQTIFSSSRFPRRNPLLTNGRNFPEMNYSTVNLIPGAGDTCELPSRSSPMKRKRHLDVEAPYSCEGKSLRPEDEEVVRFPYVEDSSCKQPHTVAFCVASKVNTEQNFEEDDPELPRIRDLTASPFRNRKPEFSDMIDMKRLEGFEPESESFFNGRCSGSEPEVDRNSRRGSRNGVTAVQPAPFPESNPDEDSSTTVELEECFPPAQMVEMNSTDTANLAVDSTTKSPKPSSPSPVGIVPTAYTLPDDPPRDCSSDRKSISKPISFFLSARSFEKVC